MNKKPKILLTNDDGISAVGLKHLWNALTEFTNMEIVAPAEEKSGVGVSITLREPLRSEAVKWEKSTPAWKVSGTPADCVRFGLTFLTSFHPQLIVSGINRGGNSGRNLLYSGTVGAVIEGSMRNIPGIAFSCEEYMNPNYQDFEEYIFPIVDYAINHPMPKGIFLNVSFPCVSKGQIKGIKFARQGMGYYKEDFAKRLHPEGYEYYWMGGKWDHQEEHHESDVQLLKEGYVTVVPIQIHQLTDHKFYEDRKDHFASLVKF